MSKAYAIKQKLFTKRLKTQNQNSTLRQKKRIARVYAPHHYTQYRGSKKTIRGIDSDMTGSSWANCQKISY